MILTTHRIIFKYSNNALEIPLFYVKKAQADGGIFHSNRIEIILNRTFLGNNICPPYLIEYTKKIL